MTRPDEAVFGEIGCLMNLWYYEVSMLLTHNNGCREHPFKISSILLVDISLKSFGISEPHEMY
ncbi:predicted protein [Botrytis cinerea T4]|uniref:Uncharacterized protein n=1 Tax=Botryotinia fuckeliana (strain T4) TaxID=999810 RepID=G2Y452_BOTF4|nr:predicted protein [Botrytis cinerea T4]